MMPSREAIFKKLAKLDQVFANNFPLSTCSIDFHGQSTYVIVGSTMEHSVQ